MRPTFIATTLLTLATTLCTAGAAAQQTTLKPGLWQLDMTMPGQAPGNSMGDYKEVLKAARGSMPPEQRKALDKALADLEASGTEFNGDQLRTRTCMTAQALARYDLLGKNAPESCTSKATPMAGGVNVNMSCTQPPMKMVGTVKFQGEKAYTFESVVTMTGPGGQPMRQKTTGSGQWLGSDCGKLKPASSAG